MSQPSLESATPTDTANEGHGVGGDRRALIALGGVTLIAALLRAWRMSDFWLSADEGIYYFSTLCGWESAQELIHYHAHPPLYYWILYGLARWNGDLQVLRMTSLVPGVLCVPAMYFLVRSLAGKRAALCSAFLVALSPGGLFLSQVIRPYSMQLLFLILGLAGLLRYLASPRTRWLVLHSGALLIATLLHYSSLIVLAGVGVCLVGLVLWRKLDFRGACRLFAAQVPLLASSVWLFVTHVRPSLMGSEHQAFARETWLSRGFLDSPTQLWDTLVDLLVYLFGRPTDVALLAALPLGLMACVKRRLGALLLFSCGTGATALALSFRDLYPLLGHRHCLYLLVVLAPLAGVGLEFLATMRERRMRVLALLLALVMAAGIVQLPELLRRNWRSAERAPEYSAVEKVRAKLDSEELSGGMILTDTATGVLLASLYEESREDYVPVNGGPVFALEVGGRRFHCLRNAFRLSADRAGREQAGHLERLLDELERLADAGHIPALPERVWIVQTGYGQQVQRVLPLTLPDGTFLRSWRIGAFSFSVIALDRAAYRRYLEG
ncbi:MAG TPA: glycosyltransferase family 39 protein [Planctomycetota bacterium]|nr:glycosyltransferase family 39 protein [Planctomycetota bacterium]